MKYIALIFSVYITMLSVLPCQDSTDMIASVTQVNVQISHLPGDEKGQEACPPFCTCNCCSTARILTAAVITSVFTNSITRDYPHYSIPAIQEQPIKIWQPPQIG